MAYSRKIFIFVPQARSYGRFTL